MFGTVTGLNWYIVVGRKISEFHVGLVPKATTTNIFVYIACIFRIVHIFIFLMKKSLEHKGEPYFGNFYSQNKNLKLFNPTEDSC